jgi:hypothetical protein
MILASIPNLAQYLHLNQSGALSLTLKVWTTEIMFGGVKRTSLLREGVNGSSKSFIRSGQEMQLRLVFASLWQDHLSSDVIDICYRLKLWPFSWCDDFQQNNISPNSISPNNMRYVAPEQ